MYSPIPDAVPLTIPPKVAAMFNWCEQHGIKWPKIIYPVRFPPGYIGTMAIDDIYPNERILTAPNSSLMTSKLANESELNQIFAENSEEMSRTVQLITFLLSEKYKKEDSPWAGFIGYLPEEPSNLEDWADAELEELQDQTLVFHVNST